MYYATTLLGSTEAAMIYKFSRLINHEEWWAMNDDVMGGISESQLKVDEEGYAHFSGHVKLDNKGGFCSIRHRMALTSLEGYSGFVIRLKGDGKIYRFQVKSDAFENQSYVYSIKTDGDWQTIEIPFEALKPQFRGRRLSLEAFPGKQLQEIGFLIGNKKEERFSLTLDEIEMK